jgi:hypothetical protein
MKILIIYVTLTIVNVILQTVCHIGQVKWKKIPAATISAIAYGIYTVVIVYTMCNLPLWAKVLVVALINFIGVFIVKFIEEKKQKEKLWKVEVAILNGWKEDMRILLDKAQIPYNYIEGVGRYTIFNIFCSTCTQSTAVKEIIKKYNVKYFVSESKTL